MNYKLVNPRGAAAALTIVLLRQLSQEMAAGGSISAGELVATETSIEAAGTAVPVGINTVNIGNRYDSIMSTVTGTLGLAFAF